MEREPLQSVSAEGTAGREGVAETKPRVLVVDDDRSMCELLEFGLRKRGFEIVWRTQPLAAIHMLAKEHIQAIVVDLNMPGLKGTELCQRVLANRPDLPVIVITAFGSMETAIAAIRAGAYDFLTKPFEVDTLALALQRAVQHRALCEEVKMLRQAVASSHRFEELIGVSAAMKKIYDLVARVAETDVSVLVTGESGTGKEPSASAQPKRGRAAARAALSGALRGATLQACGGDLSQSR